MKIITTKDECYRCKVGQSIDSLTPKKIFLWDDEATDIEVQKENPDITWIQYESYLLTRFQPNQSKVIKIQKRDTDYQNKYIKEK